MREFRPLVWILALAFAVSFVVLLAYALVNDLRRYLADPKNWRP